MNRNEKINTEALLVDVEKLGKEIDNLKNILTELKKNNESLKDYWDTRTSEEIFSEFNGFYNEIEKMISNLEEDKTFLKENVIASYSEYEEKAEKVVESELRA